MKTFERDGETVFLPTNEERNAFQNQVVHIVFIIEGDLYQYVANNK